MKISVVIPTYNREKYICQAIESVLQQTVKNIEIIVVDDGSTDNTNEKLKEYKEKIRYIYTEHKGPAHARNVGMRIAKGDYISFLDSDDLYYPYKTELQSKFLDNFQDIALVYTEFSAFDDYGYWDEFHLKNFHKVYKKGSLEYNDIFSETITIKEAGLVCDPYPQRKIFMGYIFDNYFNHLLVCTPSVMFRKSIIEKVGLQNENYWLFEEYDFVLRICKYYKVAFIDIPAYKYRYHNMQISNTRAKDGLKVTIQKQINLLKIAEEHGLNDKEFYNRNKILVNKRLAILNRVLAILFIGKGNEPKRARRYLKNCFSYGYPSYFLWIVTFLPYILRRIILKILSIFHRI